VGSTVGSFVVAQKRKKKVKKYFTPFCFSVRYFFLSKKVRNILSKEGKKRVCFKGEDECCETSKGSMTQD